MRFIWRTASPVLLRDVTLVCLAAALVVAAASPVAAVVAGAVLSTRLFPYGLAVADVVDGPWWRRLLGTHVITDESVAFALRQSSRGRRGAGFWALGGAG